MAISKKDMEIKSRAKAIYEANKEKRDKEIISLFMGILNISQRTASQHLRMCKFQQTFDFKENCAHEWSNWFATAKGLGRECKLCHKTEDKD